MELVHKGNLYLPEMFYSLVNPESQCKGPNFKYPYETASAFNGKIPITYGFFVSNF